MVGAVAQRVKEAEITEQDSMLLTRNLLRIAIFNISYIRGLFPEKYFNDKSVPALEMKIKKLMPMDAESRRLIDWMEKGVYDALQKKYLKTLLFCICQDIEGPMIEEYAFSFSYPSSNADEVCMNVSRNGSKRNSATFKSNVTEVTPDQMRSSACKMVRTLVSLMRTLDQMPSERTILMKLLYYEDITPDDYEPPFFRSCSEQEAVNNWTKNPLKMEVGNVNSKHVFLALKVKSVLDPCEDENDNLPDDEEVSLGDDSVQGDYFSSDSEVHPSHADQYVVEPIGKKNSNEDDDMVSDACLKDANYHDETQDVNHESEQTARVKEWINQRHINTFDIADILSKFPDISMALSEDIVERLLKEGLISSSGKDSYTINKEINSETCDVKQEIEMQDVQHAEQTCKSADEDYMYMKALYYALPMDYVTVGNLQSKLDGEVNQKTVRKLIEKMTKDGYLKNTGSGRLGKRVIHSESSNRKLIEVKKVIEEKPTTCLEQETLAAKEQTFDFIGKELPPNEENMKDGSTFGGLHSIGSDLTRTRGKSEPNQNGSGGQGTLLKGQECCNTPPISKQVPISSLESGVIGERTNGRSTCADDDCRSTQDKRSRKSSTVKEPILQYAKRQKAQA